MAKGKKTGSPADQHCVFPELDLVRDRSDAPRSWVGGLPRMPSDMAWPTAATAQGTVVLQHMAQICCADLPSELWDGAGPRTGWLILFSDTSDDGGEPGTAVLYTETLGPERQPPKPAKPPLRYWPLKISSEADRDSRDEENAEIDPHPHRASDALRPEYAPFDWPTAIKYVEVICEKFERAYGSDSIGNRLADKGLTPEHWSFKRRLNSFSSTIRSKIGVYTYSHELKRAIKSGNWESIGPMHGVDQKKITEEFVDKWRQQADKWPLTEALRELFNIKTRNRRLRNRLWKTNAPKRYETLARLADLPERIRELAASGKSFTDAGPPFLQEFRDIQFPFMEFRDGDFPVIEVRGIATHNSQAEYAEFVYYYVAEMFANNDPALAEVPPDLVEYLLKKWAVGSKSVARKMGGYPDWLQEDHHGLFDAAARKKLIAARGKSQAPKNGADSRDFDAGNALLLQLPSDCLLTKEYQAQYFCISRKSLIAGDFAEVISLVQTD